MSNQKTFTVETLGCRTNQYESQAYVDQLKAMGYRAALDGEEADLCVVNTCTVTESADRSSRHKIRLLGREHPNAKLIVTGCLAERAPAEVKEISGVDLVISNTHKERLLSYVFPDEEIPEFAIAHFADRTRAFVKIQDGCNSFCTYCIIPYVRGRSRSRTLDAIVQEVRGLIANGYKEVVLTGINIGDFDGAPQQGQSPCRLSDLVRAVDSLPGLHRLRVSSIDPDEVDEDLAAAILQGKTTCHSMHIVLQSGSNVILKRMNRKYTREIFLETVETLRGAAPDFTFTTDVIVGFPGESEWDFQDTLDVMRRVQFAKVHMFPYSERKRTKAASYPNKISKEQIGERKHSVLRLAERLAFELRERFLGQTMSVLIENDEETMPGYISGLTANFLPVFIAKNGRSLQPNDLVHVELSTNTPQGLIGTYIE